MRYLNHEVSWATVSATFKPKHAHSEAPPKKKEKQHPGIIAAALDSAHFEEAPEDDIVLGSPRAAARALEHNVGAKKPAE